MANLGYDWVAIEAAATGMNSVLTKYDNAITAMYDVITAMGENWSGESYNAFKQYCEDYRTGTLSPISEDIKGWVGKLNNLASSAKTTQSGNVGLFNGGGSASSGGGGGAGNSYATMR